MDDIVKLGRALLAALGGMFGLPTYLAKWKRASKPKGAGIKTVKEATMITIEQYEEIMPFSKHRLPRFADALNEAMELYNINTPQRQAAFIAQLAHESGELRYMEELASGEAYDDRADLGNTRPEAIAVAHANGSTPGRWWKGHGPIQITGYDNHLACGKALGIDLVNNPRLLTEPGDGCRSAAWFWMTRGLNDLADADNFRRITIRINGGLNGYDDRLKYWERAKAAIA